ncbi:MAG: hypothetical protein NZ920_00340 [Aigarchaeota archaeon]|nr:hypothetical protein [Aigarchaeota archaeon]MDW8092743.1 hypothetical protein [Nitrososphaerota archaeon]
MVRFSIAVEGDKDLETYLLVAKILDEHKFYSMQFYDHVLYRPAWGLAISVASHVKDLLVGPVTVPANLYDHVTNARLLAYLQTIGPGGVLGISRGAYTKSATAQQVIGAVEGVYQEVKRITWAPSFEPLIYVGTSGPLLTRLASSLPQVRGIVVDNLANPTYVGEMRRWIDEAGGRVKELIARPFTYITTDDDLDDFLQVLVRYVIDLVDGSPMLNAAGIRSEDLLNLDEIVKERVLENFSVCGTVDDVVDKVEKLLRAGATHISFGHPIGPNFIDGVRTICEKVVPSLREQFSD